MFANAKARVSIRKKGRKEGRRFGGLSRLESVKYRAAARNDERDAGVRGRSVRLSFTVGRRGHGEGGGAREEGEEVSFRAEARNEREREKGRRSPLGWVVR